MEWPFRNTTSLACAKMRRQHLGTMRIVSIAVLLLTSSLSSTAQTKFRTAELQRLAEACGVLDSSFHELTSPSFSIILEKKDSIVTHIGYQLFPDEMKQISKSPILPFLERYFLQLRIPPAGKTAAIMMQEDGFVFEKGSLKTLEQLRESDTFDYGYELRCYRASWSRDGKDILAVSFPKQHELLVGTNKIESEQLLESDIRSTPIPEGYRKSELPFKKNDLQPTTPPSEFFILNGNPYLNKLISSDIYLKEQDRELKLVVDVANPAESAVNLLLCRYASGDYTLHIDQTLYGYKRKQFDVPLLQWLTFCQQNGCELYCGIEDIANAKSNKHANDDMAVIASVFAVNQAEGYTHVLFVEVPFSIIENQQGIIPARMDCFVSTHNVSGLFAKERKTKNKTT